jgi:hypothetical protein
MLELTTTFTPSDSTEPRLITLRIGDVRPDEDDRTWSVAVEILGFARAMGAHRQASEGGATAGTTSCHPAWGLGLGPRTENEGAPGPRSAVSPARRSVPVALLDR